VAAFEWIVGHAYKASDLAGFSVAWDEGRDCFRYQTISWHCGRILSDRRGLRHIPQEGLQSRFKGNIRGGRSPRPTEPCVERVPGQPVLRAGLSQFNDELVQADGLRTV